MVSGIRIKEAVHMHDKITHLGVVDGLLRFAFPDGMSAFIIGKNTDNIEFIEIAELNTLKVFQLTTKDKMQQLFFGFLVSHHGT
jgi:hypothetical protein